MNRHLLNILILAFILGLSQNKLYSQNDKKHIYGKIINSTTKEHIPYVHIFIQGKRIGTIADSLGFFRIYTSLNDSLKLSAIGFKNKHYKIDSSKIDNSIFAIIEMKQSSYQLKQVDIHGLGSYENFRYNFNQLKVSNQLAINRVISKKDMKKAIDEGIRLAQEKGALQGASISIVPIIFFAYKQTKKLLNIKTKKRIKTYKTDACVYRILKNISKEEGEQFRDILAYIINKKSNKYPADSYELIAEIKALYIQYWNEDKSTRDSV